MLKKNTEINNSESRCERGLGLAEQRFREPEDISE